MGKNYFAWIAPIYGLFYDQQKRGYAALLDRMQSELGLSACRSFLDVGCGTGALCSVLNRRGFSVTGVDPTPGMLSIGARKQENRAIRFLQASGQRIPFGDKSFDVSITSYVAHGLQQPERRRLYAEMNRVSRHLAIIADYNQNRSTVTDIAEWLEGGDYFNFIRVAREEMGQSFRAARVIDVDRRAAWYVCTPG